MKVSFFALSWAGAAQNHQAYWNFLKTSLKFAEKTPKMAILGSFFSRRPGFAGFAGGWQNIIGLRTPGGGGVRRPTHQPTPPPPGAGFRPLLKDRGGGPASRIGQPWLDQPPNRQNPKKRTPTGGGWFGRAPALAGSTRKKSRRGLPRRRNFFVKFVKVSFLALSWAGAAKNHQDH